MPTGKYKHTIEHNRKVSEALRGRKLSEKTKEKIREKRAEQLPPMLGKHHSAASKRAMSMNHKGYIPWNKGRKMSIEFRKKKSEAHKGQIPWIKGKSHSIETKKKLSEIARERLKDKKNHPLYGKKHTETTRKKISMAHKGKILTKEHIKKSLRRRIPSSLEKKFQEIINKYNLPYKFVGDGSFIIKTYNPDFINTNGERDSN